VFTFSTHPAAIAISDGIQSAFSYLQTTWQKWLPVVVVSAVLTGVLYMLLGAANTRPLYYVDDYTGRLVWYPDAANRIWGIVGVQLGTTVVSLVSGWVFTALAIAGLRNRPLTVSFVVVRGLVSMLASLLLGAVAIGALFALAIAIVAAPPVGLLLGLVAIPVVVYFVIRVIFYTLAIFDGFGPIAAISESWRLSTRAVLRMFGWGLMAFVITIGFGIFAVLLGNLFTSPRLMAIGQAVSSLVTMTASCYTVFLMAVLYESERARHDPAAFGYAAGPGYPPPYPGGPYPYGPGAYPYAAGPYPAGPYAYPGAPAPYPGAPGPYPGAPSPYPGAPAQYPGGPMPYPGGPGPSAWPGGPAPYPGVPAPYPGGSGGTGGPGAAPESYAGPGILPYQGAAPSYPGSGASRWSAPPAPETPGTGSEPGPAWKSGDTDEPAPPADPTPSA
jgi:hypothetical protein